MQPQTETTLFLTKTTRNFAVYTAQDHSMVVYVKRDRLTRIPPDVVVGSVRRAAPADAPLPA